MLIFTPNTLAPNTITIIGFLTHVIATITLVCFLPFSSPAPDWALFLYGFAVFAYQMLDNLDGKQARKIGNSTPLGMIMDHGCDALGVIFLTAGVARTICLDNHYIIVWAYFSLVFSLQPGSCSPSRRVVSNICTCSAINRHFPNLPLLNWPKSAKLGLFYTV